MCYMAFDSYCQSLVFNLVLIIIFILIFDICAYINMIVVLFRLLNNDRSFLSLIQYIIMFFEIELVALFVH